MFVCSVCVLCCAMLNVSGVQCLCALCLCAGFVCCAVCCAVCVCVLWRSVFYVIGVYCVSTVLILCP